jgi:CRISPR-associated protein Cas1
MMLPLDAHHVQTQRHLAQVEASVPVKKRIWQALVSAKIAQQGAVLLHFTGQHGGLLPLSKRVRSGDPDNLEAQAAQRYWPLLFGKDFRRDRDEEGINAMLNYGYAVVRAAVARSIVASGLIPSLGVFHSNRSNPFCLADDLFEPYRPYVDWRVRLLVNESAGQRISLDDKPVRAALLSLFTETVLVGGRRNPMLLAIEVSATSLARALTGGKTVLALPEGLPLEPDLLDGGDAG